ncbi:LamG-like jellyroll fold domain-containing protein [Lachnospiraceae bacterium 29-84]
MKGRNVLKRVLSLALSTAMVVTMLPAQMAQAAEADEAAFPQKLAYFSFDENVTDGQNAEATVGGGAPAISTTDKRMGAGALQLANNAWLTVTKKGDANDNLLVGKKELTISYWSKYSGGNGWAFSATKGNVANAGGKENYIGVMDTRNAVEVERYKDGRSKPKFGKGGLANEWRMVTIVFAETSTKLYLNGKEAAAQADSWLLTEILDAGSRLMIGRANWGNGEYFAGLIDEFSVFDGALTDTQVMAEYLTQLTTDERMAYLGVLGQQKADCVTGDLNLPAEVDGVKLTWSSDNEAAISKDGKAGVFDGSVVTLTVTASCPGRELFTDSIQVTMAADIVKKYVDADGKELKEAEVAAAKQLVGGAFTYTLTGEDGILEGADGKTYVLDRDASVLTIDKVAKDSRTITLRYIPAQIVSVAAPQEETYYTVDGNAPILPAALEATTDAGTKMDVAVSWDTEGLKADQDNEVEGTVTGYDGKVIAKVHVYPCDEKPLHEDVEASDQMVHTLARPYKGVIVTEYEIEASGEPNDAAVLYMDSNPGAGGAWSAGAAMLHFNQGFFQSRTGDGNGNAGSYPEKITDPGALAYDKTKVYRVRVVMDSNTAPGNYHIYVTEPNGAVHEITKPEGNAFRKYNQGIIQNWFAARRGFRVKNHKISWVSGYATKRVEYYIAGALDKESTIATKEMPGMQEVPTVAKQRTVNGKTYYLDETKSGWAREDGVAADGYVDAGKTLIYRAYYEEAEIVKQKSPITVNTRIGVAPELPKSTIAVFDLGGLELLKDVEWPVINASDYEKEGRFEAVGKFKGTDVEVKATVVVKPLSEFLMAEYTFDEEVLSDSTGKKADAKKNNRVDSIDGIKGKAIQLPGGEGGKAGTVTLPEDLMVENGSVQDDFTISMYVKVANKRQQSTALLLHADKLNEGWSQENSTRNHIALYNRDSDRDGEDGLWVEYFTKQDMDSVLGGRHIQQTAADKWEHIAFVTKGSTGEAWLYKNGELVDHKTGITVKASDLKGRVNSLGGTDWPDPDYAAAFDEFQVYNAVLNEKEIKGLCDSAYQAQAEAAADRLEIGYVDGSEFDPAHVTKDLKLLDSMEAVHGLEIKVSWKSNREGVVTSDGKLIRPNFDEDAVLTAEVTVGGCSAKKEFHITAAASETVTFERLDQNIARAQAAYEAAVRANAYTKASTDALKAVVDAAKAVRNKEDVTREEIKAAADSLNTAAEETLVLKTLEELGDALAASYPLASDAKDISGNNKDGSATEKVTFSKKEGATFVGDGKMASIIRLPEELFNKRDNITVSFWAKDTGNEQNRNQAVFSIGSGSDPNADLNTDPNADPFRYVLVNTNDNSTLRAIITKNTWHEQKSYTTSQPSFAKNTWAHITLVFDGTRFAVYKNGQFLDASDTGLTISDLGDLTGAYIGNSIWGAHGNDNDYIGSVKDFRVFHASLEAAQVKAVYESGKKDGIEDAIADLVKAMGATAAGTDRYNLKVTGSSLELPVTGAQDERIRWVSQNPAVINVETGKVTPVAGQAPRVNLTAAITLDGVSRNITFICTVYDLSALKTLIEAAGALESDTYTAKSWADLQDAIKTAQGVLADPASAAEITAAEDGIKAAQEALVDLTALKKAVEEAGKLTQGQYTSESWGVFARALEAARAVLTKADATKDEAAGAVQSLKAAQDGLVKSDKAGLNELIQEIEAENLDAADYTKETFDALTKALDDAKNLPDTSSQGEIDAAKAALETARKNLISVAGLKAAIADAKKLNQADYSAASWADFAAALELAEAVAKKSNAKASEITAAREHLAAMKDALYQPAKLGALVEQAKGYKKDGYLYKSWAALQDAIAGAEKALGDETTTADAFRAAETALQAAIDGLVATEIPSLAAKIDGLDASDYTIESWAALQTALREAQDVLAKEDSSEAEVRAAERALQRAIDSLEKKAKKATFDELNAVIEEAEKVNTQDYTLVSMTVFQAALRNAQIVAANENSSQSEVDSAKEALWRAKIALVDLRGLREAIARANALDMEAYTGNSWNVLVTALEEAKEKVELADASQETIDKAAKALTDAEAALAARADATELNRLIAATDEFRQADYVAGTWADFQLVKERAKATAADSNATQAQVNEVLRLLEAARDQLVRRADKTDLNARIAEIQRVVDAAGEEQRYTTATWTAMKAALEEAKKVAAHVDAVDADAMEALEALDQAVAMLQIRGDKAALNNYIALAGSLQEQKGRYTKESWARMETALAAAQAVAADADALQEEINVAAAALKAARESLILAAYTVTIDYADGSQIVTATVITGQYIPQLGEPERDGYRFEGWFAQGASTAFDFRTPITADTALVAKWTQLPSVSGASVTVAKATYTGKALKPKVTVTYNGKVLKSGTDYTLKYSNNKKPGQATVVVTGKGDYSGSKVVKFNVLPKKVQIDTLKNKKGKKIALKFTKAPGAGGYEVVYAANKNFKSAKKKTVTSRSVTLSGLKKNKTYYVKVRAYKTINGKRVYGLYSPKMKVKIKK